MHRVLRWLARRAAVAGKGPAGSTDNAAVVLPFVPPIVIAVASWLIVTME